MIEMLNVLNALSEDSSLLVKPPWANPYLCLAIVMSVILHYLFIVLRILVSSTFPYWLTCSPIRRTAGQFVIMHVYLLKYVSNCIN